MYHHHSLVNLVVFVTVFDASLRNTTMQSIVYSESKAKSNQVCTSTGLSSWDQSSPSKKTHSELNWLKKISLTPFLNHSVHQNWLVACTVTHSNTTMQWDPKVRWTFYQFLYTIFLLIVVTSFPFSFQIISRNFTTEVEKRFETEIGTMTTINAR